MRSREEIVARIAQLEHADFFGAARGELIGYLPFDDAKAFLKPEVKGGDWKVLPQDKASIVAQILDYMPFAWEKANGCRGLSAGRSLDHMAAWLWMIEEPQAAEAIGNYTMYGKPQLRAICEKLGLGWKQWDNDQWTNSEGSSGVPAESVPRIELPWRPRS